MQLLLEFFCEEIPARMQKRAEEDLARLLLEQFERAGFAGLTARTYSGPRRLAAVVEGLSARAPDTAEERKGPRVGAPAGAVQGFLKAAGLAAIEEAEIVADPKGDFYRAKSLKKGQQTTEIIAQIVPQIAKAFPWPKSMRSGGSDFVWVRPLRGIVCVFDGAEVAFEVGGVRSGAYTQGHRFHAPGAIRVNHAGEYLAKLERAYVLGDRERRRASILDQAERACAERDLRLAADAGLLEEVTGLAEWPVVILGDMDPAFLDLPGEVIRLTMRTHQRYFAVRQAESDTLAPHFLTVANIEASDGGAAIAAGNGRVLSARLNDARFFWDGDRALALGAPARVEKLKKIVFHQQLGSVWDKVERVRARAAGLCAATGADPALVDRAALLMKADLVTETVGEFPELQGQIGRLLFLAQSTGADAGAESIAAAIEDHYRPLGPSDRVPEDPVALTLALADKLDTLTAFWAIGEKPTGSKDPYALRRAALGLVRIVLESGVRLPLARHTGDPDLTAFLLERLRNHLREQGARHDVIEAGLAPGPVAGEADDDLVRIAARVAAVAAFLARADGADLLAGYKRAANILAAEEKKGRGLAPEVAAAGVNAALLREPAERALHAALSEAAPKAAADAGAERFSAAMEALAGLREPLDRFFEAVLVNAEEAGLRANRLLLLTRIRAALAAVADFSQIEG